MTPARRRPGPVVVLAFGVALAFVYRAIFSGQVIASDDAMRMAIPDATLLLDFLGHHEWPGWTPYARLGQPFAASLHSQALYLPRILAVLAAGPVWGITLEQVFHAALACGGTYWACRGWGRSRLASFVGGVAFGLGPLFTSLMFIPNMAGSASWTGAMVAAARAVTRGRSAMPGAGPDAGVSSRSIALAVLAVSAAGSLLAGSPETFLWQCAVVGVSSWGAGLWQRACALAAALGWAAGLAACALLPAAESLRESARLEGVVDPFRWSASLANVLALGWLNADLPRPGEEQYLIASLFQGTMVVGLAIVAAVRGRGSARRLLFLAASLAVLALGASFPPARALLSLPPFSFFRYPVKYLAGTAFCLCIGAAFGLDRARAWARRWAPSYRRRAIGWGLALAFVGVAFAMRPVIAPRAGALVGWAWGTALLLGATAIFLFARGTDRARRVHTTLALLAVGELLAVAFLGGGLGWAPASQMTRSGDIARQMPSPTQGRVSVLFTDAELRRLWPSARAQIAGSRASLIPMRNVEDGIAIVEGYGPPEPRLHAEAMQRASRGLADLAGVTHYLRADEAPFADLTPLAGPPGGLHVFASATALSRAFVVHRAQVATDAEALATLANTPQVFRATVLLSEAAAVTRAGAGAHGGADVEPERPGASAGCVDRVDWLQYRPTAIELDVDACGSGHLVVTDRYEAGWRAEVDGREAALSRADYLVRAVAVPSGKHRVKMVYRPASAAWGLALSLFSVLGVFGAVGWRLFTSKVGPAPQLRRK